MAASVNNIAAAFSSSRIAVPSSPAFSASPAPSVTTAFSSSPASSNGLAIATSWNAHSTLPRSRCFSFLSVYGSPGPRPASHFLRPQAPPPRRSRGVIAIGDGLPSTTLSYLADNTVHTTSAAELSRGKKAVILGVPAAFAPRWWPGKLTAEEMVRRAGELKERGASVVACVSVNDVFVMRAWGESIGALPSTGVMMLSDPDAGMAREMGLIEDFTGGAEGFGLRSENYCVVAANGFVKAFFKEDKGAGFDDVIRAI